MKKLLEKWYFSLVIIPIIINLSTSMIRLPASFEDWHYTITAMLVVLVIILIFEKSNASKEIKNIKKTPKNSDKQIVKRLFEMLQIDTFQENFHEQDSWNGYKNSAMSGMFTFEEKALNLSHKTSDDKLNKLIEELHQSVKQFFSITSKVLYSNGGFYALDKNSDYNIKEAKEFAPKMNSQTDEVYLRLSALYDYAKQHNYLED
jgi:ferric iron reductase protein FhuF